MQIPVLTVSDLRCRVLEHGFCWQGGSMQIPVLTVSDLRCRVLDYGSCWQGGVGYIPGVSTAYGRWQDISRSGVQQKRRPWLEATLPPTSMGLRSLCGQE